MKKLLLTFSFLLFMGSTLLAGVVNIGWATDSLGNPCQYPQRIGFIIGGTATGYTQNDSLDVFVAFGDGQDTTFKTSIWNGTNYGAWAEHKYNLPGLYTVMYVVTAPDLAADTLIVPSEVIIGTSCDNISGRLYVDRNSNCVFDSGDDALTGRGVKLKLGGQVVYQTFTDQNGEYSFTAVTGLTYDVEVQNTSMVFNCPSSGTHSVSTFPANNLDFAMDCSSSQFDLESRFTGGFIVPGVARTIHFSIMNNLCTPATGITKLVLNSRVTYVPSSSSYHTAPDSINGDTLYFSFNQLSVVANQDFAIRLEGDTTLTVSDTVCLGLITTPMNGDAAPSNNVQYPCLQVRTSYDPNMKSVYPAGEGVDGFIKPDQSMIYTIDFQNTGNFMATNIFVLDTIDTQTLDLNTLEILDYSHPMNFRIINNNILKFNFDNIMLPDSNSNEPQSHGYVSFRIDQKAALPDGTKIENKVGIYFDYNPAVITNTTLNTINRFIGIEEVQGNTVSLFQVYPNPTSCRLNVELEAGLYKASISLYDLNGRKLLQREVDDRATLDVSHLPAGIYILSAGTEAGSQQKRVVIH